MFIIEYEELEKYLWIEELEKHLWISGLQQLENQEGMGG